MKYISYYLWIWRWKWLLKENNSLGGSLTLLLLVSWSNAKSLSSSFNLWTLPPGAPRRSPNFPGPWRSADAPSALRHLLRCSPSRWPLPPALWTGVKSGPHRPGMRPLARWKCLVWWSKDSRWPLSRSCRWGLPPLHLASQTSPTRVPSCARTGGPLEGRLGCPGLHRLACAGSGPHRGSRCWLQQEPHLRGVDSGRRQGTARMTLRYQLEAVRSRRCPGAPEPSWGTAAGDGAEGQLRLGGCLP